MRALFPLRCPGRCAELLILITLVALATSTGCGDGANVTLQAMMDMAITSPANSVSDGWTNTNLTPTGYAVGLQSAKLTNSSTADSFTIFDQGTGAPLFTRLYNSPTRITVASQNDISNGTYDQLELQVIYYEADIAAVDASDQTHIRRLRSYFQDTNEPLITSANNTVFSFDMLLSNVDMTVPTSSNPNDIGSGGTNLQWINQNNGSPCTPRSSCTNNTNTPYQGNSGLFAGYPTVTISFPPGQEITVDSSTNSTFIVNVTAGVQNLFFYDETSSPSNNVFNYQYLNNPASSKDGTIQAACTNTLDCANSAQKTADFWIGPPLFSLSVKSQ
jgi:hypothetical protein